MSERTFMQTVIPSGESEYASMRTGFGGLNETGQIDTGEISSGAGFTTAHLPEIRTIRTPGSVRTFTADVITATAVADIILVVAFDGASTNLYYLRGGNMYVGKLADGEDRRERSIVQFNVYDDPTAVTGKFVKKLLVFPDKKTLDYDIASNFTLATMPDSVVPNIDYATVFNARLFGVKDGKIYASAFNSYANWDLDTAENYSEANAWMSETQSNPKAQNSFVALTVYDGHPVGFKPDYMQTIYNTKNPFRVVDIGEFGCVSNRAHCQCLGALFFASYDGVYMYTGGYPSRISDKLSPKDYTGAELVSYDDEVYMNLGGTVYTYSVKNGAWARGEIFGTDYGFGNMVATAEGVYIFGGNAIFKLRSGSSYYSADISVANVAMSTTDAKRPKEIALLYRLEGTGTVSVGIAEGADEVRKETSVQGTHSARLLTRGLAGDIHDIKLSAQGDASLCYLQLKYAKGGNDYAR